MGHQESFVRVKDNSKFDTFFSMVKSLGKEVFEESGAYPVSLITLKKQIKGNLAMMCEPDLKYKFPAGERFIYFVGDRSAQRNGARLLHKWAPEDLEIYFAECFPADKIFKENSKYATVEDFELESNKLIMPEFEKCLELERQLEVYGRDYSILNFGEQYDTYEVDIYKTDDNKLFPICHGLKELEMKLFNKNINEKLINNTKNLATLEDVRLFVNKCKENHVQFYAWGLINHFKDGVYSVAREGDIVYFCPINDTAGDKNKQLKKGGIMKSTSISEILLKKLPYIDVFGQKKRATGWKIENKTQEYYELFFGDHIKNNNPKFYYSLNNEIKLGMEIEKQNEEYAYITTTYLDEKNLRCVGSLILNLKDETCYCNDITDFLLELELLIDIKFNLDYLISELDFYADLGSAYGDVVQKVDEVVEIIRSSTNLKHEQYKNLFSVFLRSWNDLDEEDKEQELMDLGL